MMNLDIAYLLCRMQCALIEEGIGPRKAGGAHDIEDDRAIMNAAASMVYRAGLMTAHDLWDSGLKDDEFHDANCGCWYVKLPKTGSVTE